MRIVFNIRVTADIPVAEERTERISGMIGYMAQYPGIVYAVRVVVTMRERSGVIGKCTNHTPRLVTSWFVLHRGSEGGRHRR